MRLLTGPMGEMKGLLATAGGPTLLGYVQLGSTKHALVSIRVRCALKGEGHWLQPDSKSRSGWTDCRSQRPKGRNRVAKDRVVTKSESLENNDPDTEQYGRDD